MSRYYIALECVEKAVIAVRVSGGHLCEAEAPTEPAGETAVRRAAIRSPFKDITDSFALITLAVPKSCYSLGARTTFDRGASFCSLLPAPQALASSLRMTRNKTLSCHS